MLTVVIVVFYLAVATFFAGFIFGTENPYKFWDAAFCLFMAILWPFSLPMVLIVLALVGIVSLLIIVGRAIFNAGFALGELV